MGPTYKELLSARQYCLEQVDYYSNQSQYSTIKNKKYFQELANNWEIRMGELDGLIENKRKDTIL